MDPQPWNPATLAALADAREVDVTPVGTDGSPGATRTVWSIGVGDSLYVRSWKGPEAVWFRGAIASGRGTIAVTGGGVSQEVTFETVDAADPVQRQISATFLSKYDGDSEAAVMNGQKQVDSTLRLVPRAE
jgi:hypothetical protein